MYPHNCEREKKESNEDIGPCFLKVPLSGYDIFVDGVMVDAMDEAK